MNLNILPHPAAPDGFPFLENHVRARLGWSRDVIRAARKNHLAASDFARFKKRVFLSATGLATLAGLCTPPTLEKNAPPPPRAATDDPQPVTRPLLVCNPAVTNPRIILACPSDQNPDRPVNVFRVRIRPGTQLRRRQIILARSIPPYTDYYELLMARNGCPLQPSHLRKNGRP